MGDRDWFTNLVDRRYNADLLDLKIDDRAGDVHKGQGRLALTPDRDLRIWAVTQGKRPPIVGEGPIAGFSFRESRYVLTARSLDGWSVEVRDVFDESSDYLEYIDKIWEFPARQATLTLPFEVSKFRGIGAILGPADAHTYPRRSKYIYENPRFSHCDDPLDWFEFESVCGKVSGNQRGEHCFVVIESDLDLPSLERALEAVQLAISFVEGRAIGLSGYEASLENFTHRKVFTSSRTTQCRLCRPIGTLTLSLNVSETLMSVATEFFLTERGHRYSDWLRMCWNSSDTFLSNQVIILWSMIEFIAKDFQESLRKVPFTQDEDEVIESLKEILQANRAHVGEGFRNRIENYLNNLHKVGSLDVLRDWAGRSFLGFSKADFDDFKRLRNSVAHGELLFTGTDIAKWEFDVTSVIRLQNFLNRLILYNIGYEGMYFDHSEHKPMIIVGTTVRSI